MPRIEPLPFRIRLAGEDVIDLRGVRSVSYRVEGLVDLVDDYLRFEWTATEKTEVVSLTKVGSEVDHSPIGRLEIPACMIADARLRKGLVWLPLHMRARSLDGFEGMPGANAGAVSLRVRRRYRKEAKDLVARIRAGCTDFPDQ